MHSSSAVSPRHPVVHRRGVDNDGHKQWPWYTLRPSWSWFVAVIVGPIGDSVCVSVQLQACRLSWSLVWGSSTVNFATSLSPFSASHTSPTAAAELVSWSTTSTYRPSLPFTFTTSTLIIVTGICLSAKLVDIAPTEFYEISRVGFFQDNKVHETVRQSVSYSKSSLQQCAILPDWFQCKISMANSIRLWFAIYICFVWLIDWSTDWLIDWWLVYAISNFLYGLLYTVAIVPYGVCLCVLLQARRRLVWHLKHNGDNTGHACSDHCWPPHAERKQLTCSTSILKHEIYMIRYIFIYDTILCSPRMHNVGYAKNWWVARV